MSQSHRGVASCSGYGSGVCGARGNDLGASGSSSWRYKVHFGHGDPASSYGYGTCDSTG